MLNNPDEVMGIAFKTLGYSINDSDPEHFEQARQKLLAQKPLLIGYIDPITLKKKLIDNEIWAASLYSEEGMSAADKNEDLVYILPEEGAARWIDCLAISRDSPHAYTAEVFINYILDPKVSAAIANYLWYANCNSAARRYTDQELFESPSLYPEKDVLDRCEFFMPMGTSEELQKSQQMHNRLWAELLGSKKKQNNK